MESVWHVHARVRCVWGVWVCDVYAWCVLNM